jgi:uncharacterized protein DUF748
MLKGLNNWLKQCRQKLSWQLFAKIFASVFVFYLLISYFAVDPLAKKLIPRIANNALDSIASVKRVEFDPFRLKATIHELDLTNKTGDRLAGFKKLVVDFELSGMFDLAWKFKQIGIAEPHVNLLIAQGGKLNWDALIAKLNEGPEQLPSDTIPSVIIEHFIVSEGNVHYQDANRPAPIDMTLAPLNFQLKGFSTVPKDRGEYLISAAFSEEGGVLKWKGDMGVNPVASTGIVSLEGVKIAETLQLIKGLALPINITNGEVQTSFNYDFAMPNTVPTVALSNMTINVTELAGESVDGGAVRLTHAGFIVPRLDFVQDQQPELHLKDLDFKLLDLNLSQANGSRLILKSAIATLPTLDFGTQSDQPQLTFNDLNIRLNELDLQQSSQMRLKIPSTELNAMNFDLSNNSIKLKDILVSGIELSPKAKQLDKLQNEIQPIATLEKITITDGQIGLVDKTVNVGSILLSGIKTSVIKSADNSLNWVALFDAKDTAPVPSTDSTEQEKGSAQQPNVTSEVKEDSKESQDNKASVAWSFKVPSVALNQANVHIQDNSAPSAIVMDVQDASIEFNNVTSDTTKPLPFKAAFTVKQGGQLSANGKLWPSPLKADLRLQLSKLSLKPFAPYVNQFALLRLNRGSADVSGQLKLAQEEAFKLDFNGKFNVEKLAVVEEAEDKPFLSWNRLGSDNLKLSLMPNKLHMGKLKIEQPSAKFIIYEDKTTNLNRILRKTTGSNQSTVNAKEAQAPDDVKKVVESASANQDSLIKPKRSAPAVEQATTAKLKTRSLNEQSATDVFPLDIDVVSVKDAKLEFADLSLTPQFGTNIHSLNGVMNSLSTKADKVAQVEMVGKVDAYGSAKISGSLQPLRATEFMDIKLTFANLDMSKLTPYSGKFAGRYIDSGRLSVDLDYKIKQQQLVAQNKFVINKIKLGDKVESDTAADLPLDLAIAILEDSNGVIDLDLPIKGSLDNPEFSFASIAWKAFRNVITKIVTAPFRALGKLFGGDGEDFDGIIFEAGSSEVSPPELEKLMNVSQALAKRQGLALGIVPSYSLAADTQAIQVERYRRQVMKEMGIDLEEGQKPGPVDLGNEDAQGAVDSLYNDLTNKGLLKRLASKFEEPEEGHYEKAQAKLIESIDVGKNDLNTLAQARGEAIKAALVSHGVSQERLTVADIAEVKEKDRTVITTLTLDVRESPNSGRQTIE